MVDDAWVVYTPDRGIDFVQLTKARTVWKPK
jgi:hypothetical protein